MKKVFAITCYDWGSMCPKSGNFRISYPPASPRRRVPPRHLAGLDPEIEMQRRRVMELHHKARHHHGATLPVCCKQRGDRDLGFCGGGQHGGQGGNRE